MQTTSLNWYASLLDASDVSQVSLPVVFEVVCHGIDDLPKLMCDGVLLTHILLNLCQNSARFTTVGRITLVVSAAPHTEADPARSAPRKRRPLRSLTAALRPCNSAHWLAHSRVVGRRSSSSVRADIAGKIDVNFAVYDTGPGLQRSVSKQLFTRYVSVGGVGIGLNLSNELVTALGGKMEVLSPWNPPAPGTCFRFNLSLASADGESSGSGRAGDVSACSANVAPNLLREKEGASCKPTDVTAKPSAATPSLLSPPAMRCEPNEFKAISGARVLVADDVLVNRRLLRRIFQKFGCIVMEAASAEQVASSAIAVCHIV